MSLVKAQRGAETENERINSGERQDTLLNDVAAITDNFKSALKSKSDEALAGSIHDNAMKLGDPKLLEMIQGIGKDDQNQDQNLNTSKSRFTGTWIFVFYVLDQD